MTDGGCVLAASNLHVTCMLWYCVLGESESDINIQALPCKMLARRMHTGWHHWEVGDRLHPAMLGYWLTTVFSIPKCFRIGNSGLERFPTGFAIQ